MTTNKMKLVLLVAMAAVVGIVALVVNYSSTAAAATMSIIGALTGTWLFGLYCSVDAGKTDVDTTITGEKIMYGQIEDVWLGRVAKNDKDLNPERIEGDAKLVARIVMRRPGIGDVVFMIGGGKLMDPIPCAVQLDFPFEGSPTATDVLVRSMKFLMYRECFIITALDAVPAVVDDHGPGEFLVRYFR